MSRWLGAEEIAELLTPQLALAAVGDALEWCRLGTAQTPSRERLEHNGTLLLSMRAAAEAGIAEKVLTLNTRASCGTHPTIQGVLLIFDANTGSLRGVLDGGAVTAIRTAAIAAWATDRLASASASRMLLVGAGAQARWQVEAILSVRDIQEVTIWNRTRAKAQTLANTLKAQHPYVTFTTADDLHVAARDSDVITLVTACQEPMLEFADLPATCHINAMGAHERDARELASDVMAHADIYADTLDGCLNEAGDLLIPLGEGVLDLMDIQSLATAGTRKSDITVMKSVGSAVFDLACGALLLDALDARGGPRAVSSGLALVPDQ